MSETIEEAQDRTRPEPLMSPDEVATYLSMPRATLQLWRVKGTGPRGYRVGRHVRYRLADVELWLEERADDAAA